MRPDVSRRVRIETLERRQLMSGDGLVAQFFNRGATTPASSRVDATVDANWGKASPDAAVKPNKFTAVWTGQVEAPADGNYTFATFADDGTRLFINGQLIIDNLKGKKLRVASGGAVALSAATPADIRLEYYERKGAAQVQLLWSADGGAKSVVPQTALFSQPQAAPAPDVSTPPPTSEPIATPTPTPAPVPAPIPTAPQPAPGGRTILVDPAGPIRSVEQGIRAAAPGDVVLVRPGRYFESFTMPGNGGTADRPITVAAAEPSTVVIDGTGHEKILRCGAASFINLSGLVFEHAEGPIQSAAVEISEGWVMADCVVRNTDAGGAIVYGDGAKILRSVFEYNGQQGLNGVNCENVLVQDSITRFNNRGVTDPAWAGEQWSIKKDGLWYVDPNFEAGAGKWVRTQNVTIERMTSYANGGPGIWFDYDNANVTIRNCTVYDNVPVANDYEAIGINIELTQGPTLIENNTVRNHAGSNLMIQSSSDVVARANTLENGALELRDWDRGPEYKTRRIAITDNRLTNVRVQAFGGEWNRSAAASKTITLDRNVYADVGRDMYFWGSEALRSLAEVRSALGLERNGVAA